jgi:hypothetical protein
MDSPASRVGLAWAWLPPVSLAGLAFAMERGPHSLGGLHSDRVYMPAMICDITADTT